MCGDHKTNGMVNLNGRRCALPGCKVSERGQQNKGLKDRNSGRGWKKMAGWKQNRKLRSEA